jgi:hypothetical protein
MRDRFVWEPGDIAVIEVERDGSDSAPRDAEAAWDESLHPRDESGKFTEGGAGAGSAVAYEAELARQSAVAVAACEKVIDQAVVHADYEAVGPSSWDDVSPDDKDAILQSFVEDKESEWRDNELQSARESFEADIHNELRNDEDFIGEVKAEFVGKWQSDGADINPESISATISTRWTDSDLILDTSALTHTDGSPFSEEERSSASTTWDQTYSENKERETEARLAAKEDEIYESAQESLNESINEAWAQWSDEDRFNYGKGNDLIRDSDVDVTPGPPSRWISGAIGEEGDWDKSDYGRTRAIAREITAVRTDQILEERGYPAATAQTGRLVADRVWEEWKGSSTSDLGLALQLATAKELGGVHRLTADEMNTARHAAGGLWNEGLHPRDANGRFVGSITHDEAVKQGRVVGEGATAGVAMSLRRLSDGTYIERSETERIGMDVLQAYVRAQWEASQFVLAKEGAERVPVYRGLMLPGADVAAAKKESVHIEFPTSPPTSDYTFGDFERLTDVSLQRSGAQSATSTRSVANSWNGVGMRPHDAQRVVLRIDAPRTAVLSLPVFGVNLQSEREVVLAGTRGTWRWDAWVNRAPSFASHPVS